MSNIEKTLSIIKPDAVERNLRDQIKNDFKNNGFEILKEKKIHISKEEAEKFYKVHESKPFYNDLCAYLSSGPIVVMSLQKDNAVLENRKFICGNEYNIADMAIHPWYGYLVLKNAYNAAEFLDVKSYKNVVRWAE